jgi:hypothetical protein
MAPPERSRERVEAYLAGLEECYGTFPVSQSTVSLPDERYETVRGREQDSERFVRAYIRVRDEASAVLHVDGDLPGVGVGFADDPERRLREAVGEAAGIECSVDDVERATIVGHRCDGDRGRRTVYHLVTVFAGRRMAGTTRENAEWHAGPNPVASLARRRR